MLRPEGAAAPLLAEAMIFPNSYSTDIHDDIEHGGWRVIA
jgi:hypothetical protein